MKFKGIIATAVIFLILSSGVFAKGNQEGSAGEAGKKPVVLTVLTDSTNGWIQNYNPFNTVLRGASNGFIYEYLVIFNEMKNNEEIPWLAKEIISEPDLQTLTVKLREDVKWSDGVPFTAEDVAFTYNYPKDHPEIDMTGYWGENGKLENVVVVDSMTVQLKMRLKNAFHRNDIFNEVIMIPKHIWENVSEPAAKVVTKPVGTGPFTEVIQFTPQLFVMGRNPYYWNKDLAIDQVKYPQFNGNEAAFEILKTGKVDWGYFFIPDIDKLYVQGDPNRKYWFPSNDGVRITFNFMSPNENNRKAFNNKAFRQAASLCMDRKSMMEVGAYGYVQGGNPASNLPPSLWGWRNPKADAIWNDFYNYDINKARKILADGGFKDVDGDGYVENPDGTPVKFKIMVPNGWTDWVNNCQIAVEGLRKAGINASVQTPEVQVYIDAWKTGDHDSIFGGGQKSPTIWKYYYDTLHSRNIKTNTWWTTTMTNYKSDKLDAMINSLPLTLDKAVQKKTAEELELYLAENVIHIPLYYNGLWHVYNTSRFTGWSTEENPYIEPGLANNDNKLYQITQLRPR